MHKVLIFLVLIIHPALALATVSVEMTVARTQVAMGESLGMQVKVTGSKSSSEPQIGGSEAFQITPTGSSSQVQIINSSMTSSKMFQYQISPLKTGIYTLGPAAVTVDGAEYRSQPITIAVTKEAAQAPADPEAGLRLELSTASPYLHEQIICTLRFESRVSIANAELAPPEFAGFWKEQLGDPTQYERVVNGQQWIVNEIKWVLFPMRSGSVTIPPIKIAATVVKQGPQRRIFSSQPVTLEVKDLPMEGRPSNFSGLVGKFEVQERANQSEVKVGDSVTLTITVSGNGNVRDIPSPTVATLKDFKVYDDEPKVNTQTGANGITGTKIFTKAIVPLKEGELIIPPFELSYFDPQEGHYKTISTQAVKLTVRPSDLPQAPTGAVALPNGAAKTDVTVVGHDVMPIVEDASLMANDGVTFRERIIFAFIALLPALAALAAWVIYRRLLRIRSDSGFSRRIQARRIAQRMIQKLSHTTDVDFCQVASRILKDYIGNRFNVDGRALTSMDIERFFREKSLPEATTSVVRLLLSEFDAGLYGGRQIHASARRTLTETLAHAINSIEKAVGR